MLLDSVINSRDLGGIKIGNKTIKKGLLFRTAHLHDISDKEVKLLQDKYNLKRVFDLRSVPEAALMPDREIPGAQHISLPTLDTEAEKQIRFCLFLFSYTIFYAFTHLLMAMEE